MFVSRFHICIIVMSSVFILHTNAHADDKFAIAPRFQIANLGVDSFSGGTFIDTIEPVLMPVYGATLKYAPDSLAGTVFNLTVLYGTGEGDFFARSATVAPVGSVDYERIDVELLGQTPIKNFFENATSSASFSYGMRYVKFDRKIKAEGVISGDLFVTEFGELEETSLILAETGVSFSQPFLDAESDSIFGSVNLGAGYQTNNENNEGFDIHGFGDDIPVFVVDASIGYSYLFNSNTSFAASYKATIFSDFGLAKSFNRNSFTAYTHGPELSLTIRY